MLQHFQIFWQIIFFNNDIFYGNIFIYIKIWKDSCAKYYQQNKERSQKRLEKDNKTYSKKKNKKGDGMLGAV